ncbi:hypothetical protein BAE44_0018554 [Dichanthelium oligosanthes]|uniref:Uncharacterized protein n=1 Tax=Dichanthelium oligosanthes TaxID=888268 RepID=A0A1E5V5S6_9POAL|nr:hypothetical protein BAE44_0018554 [Dichanthelium oligosanthes]
MESSPAAAMATPSPPASSSRARDPLLFGAFELPAGWGCRKPMGFCRDTGAPVAPEPDAPAAEAKNNDPRSPAGGAAAEEAQEAPRRQWNLRERTPWRDYRAEDARQSKKLGYTNAGGQHSRGFSVALTRQEIEADFVAITGRKPPRRPKKRTKSVQRQIDVRTPSNADLDSLTAIANLLPGSSITDHPVRASSFFVAQTLCPGSSLMEVTRDRYKVNERTVSSVQSSTYSVS